MSEPTYAEGAACCASCRVDLEVVADRTRLEMDATGLGRIHDAHLCTLNAEIYWLRQGGEALASRLEEGISIVGDLLASVDEAYSAIAGVVPAVDVDACGFLGPVPRKAIADALEVLRRVGAGKPRGESGAASVAAAGRSATPERIDMLTAEDLAEVEARRTAIPAPPWEIVDDGYNQPCIRAAGGLILDLATLDTCHHAGPVGDFMVNAPVDVSRLIATIRALEQRADNAEHLVGIANEQIVEIRGVVRAGEGEETTTAVRRALQEAEERGDKKAMERERYRCKYCHRSPCRCAWKVG